MILRVDIQPDLLRWASERCGVEADALARRFPKLGAWVRGDARPTLKQLESFAKATRTPVGYFFLPEPPDEQVPIPDLRTMGSERLEHPSPDLLDTVYACQQRQEWYRDFARTVGEPVLPFVGSASVGDDVEETAAGIRRTLGFDIDQQRRAPTWTAALRRFIEQADECGVLVMVNGIVGSNTRRKLDPEEFRGFALADDLAPLAFVNGADTKAGQMFTLAHELAHIWLGESALSDVGPATSPSHEIEILCNQVAAELLVPLADLRSAYRPAAPLREEMQRLARRFKVSTLVILRRIHDVGGLTRGDLWREYRDELDRLRAFPRGSGGNFYLTQTARVGRRFAQALIVSTLEGRTLHRDAFHLLGFSKIATFHELGHRLGVM